MDLLFTPQQSADCGFRARNREIGAIMIVGGILTTLVPLTRKGVELRGHIAMLFSGEHAHKFIHNHRIAGQPFFVFNAIRP